MQFQPVVYIRKDQNYARVSKQFTLFWWRSRHNLDCSKLVKMMIESKCHSNTELLHYNFACAIGEARVLPLGLEMS